MQTRSFPVSAGVQKETRCGNKMRLGQSENFARTSGQRFSGGFGGWVTTQNWRSGWWITVTVWRAVGPTGQVRRGSRSGDRRCDDVRGEWRSEGRGGLGLGKGVRRRVFQCRPCPKRHWERGRWSDRRSGFGDRVRDRGFAVPGRRRRRAQRRARRSSGFERCWKRRSILPFA